MTPPTGTTPWPILRLLVTRRWRQRRRNRYEVRVKLEPGYSARSDLLAMVGRGRTREEAALDLVRKVGRATVTATATVDHITIHCGPTGTTQEPA